MSTEAQEHETLASLLDIFYINFMPMLEQCQPNLKLHTFAAVCYINNNNNNILIKLAEAKSTKDLPVSTRTLCLYSRIFVSKTRKRAIQIMRFFIKLTMYTKKLKGLKDMPVC